MKPRSFMKAALIPVLFALTLLAWAEHEVTPVGRLRLLDGRTLENVVIRSYDVHVSKVLLIANGRAMLIPITLIPSPYAEKIKAENERSRFATDLVQTTPLPAPAVPDSASRSRAFFRSAFLKLIQWTPGTSCQIPDFTTTINS